MSDLDLRRVPDALLCALWEATLYDPRYCDAFSPEDALAWPVAFDSEAARCDLRGQVQAAVRRRCARGLLTWPAWLAACPAPARPHRLVVLPCAATVPGVIPRSWCVCGRGLERMDLLREGYRGPPAVSDYRPRFAEMAAMCELARATQSTSRYVPCACGGSRSDEDYRIKHDVVAGPPLIICRLCDRAIGPVY